MGGGATYNFGTLTSIVERLFIDDAIKGKSKEEQVNWYNSTGSQMGKNMADRAKYKIQENLGESIETYAQRRDEAMKRDELRKRMLGVPGDADEKDSAKTTKRELG